MSHNIYGIAYQYYKRKLNFEGDINKDVVLRFLDRCLQADAEPDDKLITRLIYSWRKRKVPKQSKGPRIQDLLRFEAQRLLQNDPDLMGIAQNGNGATVNRAQRWFNFVNQVSNKVMVHFWDSLLSNLSGAQILNMFQSLGSAGAAYTILAPYFVTFTVFSRDRHFSAAAMESFGVGKSGAGGGTRPVKIAHFTDTFHEINGVALTIGHQLELAQKTGKDLTVITCDAETRPPRAGLINFNPIGAYGLPEYPDQKMFLPPFLEMLNFCYEKGFTQIHAATPGPLGIAALAIAKIMKIPIIGTYHTAIPQYAHILTGDPSIEELVWKYTTWFYDQLNLILVPSGSTEKELIGKGIDPRKIRLFPRGVDTNRFHPSRRNEKFLKERFKAGDGPKVLYVGRISKEKDLHILAQAFIDLTRTIKDAELVIVGDGPYLNDFKDLLAGSPCIFTGFLEGDELSSTYASCDLFAFPSATDTFGNVVLEAQASGLPVIVTNCGGPCENMIPDKTGLIVPAGEVQSLLDALKLLLSNPARLKEMGKAARLSMEDRSYEGAFDETWQLYQKIPGTRDSESADEMEVRRRRKAA